MADPHEVLVATPPRVSRAKRAALYSPPCSSSYSRNQSEIALSWWAKKKEKVDRLKAEVRRLKDRIAALEDEKEAAAQYASELEAALEEQRESIDNNVAKVVESVKEYGGFQRIESKTARLLAIGALIVAYVGVIMRKTQAVTRLRAVADAVFTNAIFGAEATKIVFEEICSKFISTSQKRTFLPWKILRAIDLCMAGSLNYNGVETLRTVEGLGRYERGILPSRSQIQRASYALHDLGQMYIPFEKKDCAIGEMFAYDYERFLRFILKAFKLHDIATTESIEICMTLDGAELCDGISHLTAGIKISDHRAIDPRDGSPLSTMPDEAFGRIFKVQSRNYCFAMKTLLGKDCKSSYKEFSDFFNFFERLKKYGLAATEHGARL